ncbi:MAG: rpiB [Dehalococcoidia bacterium]|nr:rpiB [Dehalococcoidia bacterium]
MKLAVGSDERTPLTDAVVEDLKRRGHEVDLYGPLADDPIPWPDVAEQVARSVASGKSEEGVLFCWTGTGVSIAANKVPGIRAALCTDAETARGARRWNDANVLCMSLRLTSEVVAKEMLEAWFSAEPDEGEARNIAKITDLERDHSESPRTSSP